MMMMVTSHELYNNELEQKSNESPTKIHNSQHTNNNYIPNKYETTPLNFNLPCMYEDDDEFLAIYDLANLF
jgi:hypothetical protein